MATRRPIRNLPVKNYTEEMETVEKESEGKTEAMETDTETKADVPPPERGTPPPEQEEVPRGKVACLLCRGFITYKNGDESRFKSHMAEEHEVTYDTDLVLACSVFNRQERDMIVQASLQRLRQVGEGQLPTAPLGKVFQNPLPSAALPPPRAPATPSPRSAPPQQVYRRRGGGTAGVRATPPPQQPRLPPSLLSNNQSISISVVDQTTKCLTCDKMFPNNDARTVHMKAEHLPKFPGLTIATAKELEEKERIQSRKSFSKTPDPPSTNSFQKNGVVRPTPVNVKNISSFKSLIKSSLNRSNSSNQESQLRKPTSLNLSNNPNKTGPFQKATVQGPKSPPCPTSFTKVTPDEGSKDTVSPPKEPEIPKDDPVVKCNTCGKFIKQSLFKNHKKTHLQDIEDVKFNEFKRKRKEEKIIDFVDMSVDDEEEGPNDSFKVKPVSPKKLIQCGQCDKKLSTNMALRMHTNLTHPVKQELNDIEQLLEEADDPVIDAKIKNEVDNMETMELLDNLVDFLENET